MADTIAQMTKEELGEMNVKKLSEAVEFWACNVTSKSNGA
jgi:hypothetical protein